MPTSSITKKILLVIFGLDGRYNYINRYLKLFNSRDFYSSEISILLICEKDIPPVVDSHNKLNLITVFSKKKITGMNCLFKEMLNARDIIKQFSYVCFVEDDNFIFPRSIIKSADFLSRNNDFISCGGHGFLFFLQGKNEVKSVHYKLSNSLTNFDTQARLRNFGHSLMYYGVFRSGQFLNILSKISLISDDNFSEILFNFLTVIEGKYKRLNLLYLMRQYPRPTIYNIPPKFDWLSSDIYSQEFSKVARFLTTDLDSKVLEPTLYRYVGRRIYSDTPNLFNRLKRYVEKILFKAMFYKEIQIFITKLRGQ